MKVCCVVPARLQSTRLPQKLLRKINNNETVLQRVIENVKQLNFVDKIILATDSSELAEFISPSIEAFIMREGQTWCGSQRVFSVYKKYSEYDYYITYPSDEPFADPKEINKSWELFPFTDDRITTLGSSWEEVSIETFESINTCKIIYSGSRVLYFTRSASTIPSLFSKKHLGVFIFPQELLKKHGNLIWDNYKGSIAEADRLEQTLFLENGFRVDFLPVKHNKHGVDILEDLQQ